jgi:hypothetical protein
MKTAEAPAEQVKMKFKTAVKTMAWLRKVDPQKLQIVPKPLEPVTEVVVSSF